jgi:hypothetical protein
LKIPEISMMSQVKKSSETTELISQIERGDSFTRDPNWCLDSNSAIEYKFKAPLILQEFEAAGCMGLIIPGKTSDERKDEMKASYD